MPQPQVLTSDLAFGESARWHDGRFWLCDWATQEVIAVDALGVRETVVRVGFPSMPMCIDWLPEQLGGRLLIVSASDGLILRREADGTLVTHADLSHLSSFRWNEIVVDGRGNAYVNNIEFDFGGGEFAPGTITVATPDGSARQVAADVAFPNGMVVTPDGSTLIVAESYASRLTAFDIDPDGGLSGRRVWADLNGGVPDGICLDAENAVWYADVPNRCCVRVLEGGEVTQRFELDRGCFSCALGGADGCTLFLVATEWGGAEGMDGDGRTGRALTVPVSVPAAVRA